MVLGVFQKIAKKLPLQSFKGSLLGNPAHAQAPCEHCRCSGSLNAHCEPMPIVETMWCYLLHLAAAQPPDPPREGGILTSFVLINIPSPSITL